MKEHFLDFQLTNTTKELVAGHGTGGKAHRQERRACPQLTTHPSPCQTTDDDEGSPLSCALENTVSKAWSLARSDENILFGFQAHAVDLSTFHPEAVDIFRLWQLYLDNVNPLLKVTHTPSLQVRIIEAASNVMNIGPALEALMFSIYCVSVTSLDDDECRMTFGASQEDLLEKYRYGCQQALANAEFLRSADRECLTALYLYMVWKPVPPS